MTEPDIDFARADDSGRADPARARGLRSHYCGHLGVDNVGHTVNVCGWVAKRREHGEHLAFIDLRDHTGVIQCVVDDSVAGDLRAEHVIRVTGTVRHRKEGTVNADLTTGEVEVGVESVEVLNIAEPPPFPLDGRSGADEPIRLKYRYVDIRTERMQRNLRIRSAVNAATRRSMDRQGFVEVETPLLWVPTPEGAREFAVPSRLQAGAFYVLPQSPQIAKQLLMVAGIDRYYQIARCMRDEDLRADRQFEFTQLDMEMSFVSKEDVFECVADAVLEAARSVTGDEPPPAVVMTWAEALDKYGSDKPDIRYGMELVDLSAVVASTEFRAFQSPCVKAIRVPGEGAITRSRLDSLTDKAKKAGAAGLVWMRVVAGGEVDSPVAKFLSADHLSGIVTATQAVEGDLLLIVAGEYRKTCQVLGGLRLDLGQPPVSERPLRLVWVTDFPMFEEGENGQIEAAHHPFCMPHPDDLHLLESEPLKMRAQAYDLVCNGWELGSGSIRIHRADIQSRIFTALGISEEVAEQRFGFLLGAFKFGAPPHGGFAYGTDRLVAILAGEDNIREVIAFPKTQSGLDLMSGSPSTLEERQLRDIHIRTVLPD